MKRLLFILLLIPIFSIGQNGLIRKTQVEKTDTLDSHVEKTNWNAYVERFIDRDNWNFAYDTTFNYYQNWNSAFDSSHWHDNFIYLDTVNQDLSTTGSPLFFNLGVSNLTYTDNLAVGTSSNSGYNLYVSGTSFFDNNITVSGGNLSINGYTDTNWSNAYDLVNSNYLNWNTAYTNTHTHSNKSFLDVINQNTSTGSNVEFADISINNIQTNGEGIRVFDNEFWGSSDSVLSIGDINGSEIIRATTPLGNHRIQLGGGYGGMSKLVMTDGNIDISNASLRLSGTALNESSYDYYMVMDANDNVRKRTVPYGYVPVASNGLMDAAYLPPEIASMEYYDDSLDLVTQNPAQEGVIYITIFDGGSWVYVQDFMYYQRINSVDPLSLGITSTTAFRGDYGNTAYQFVNDWTSSYLNLDNLNNVSSSGFLKKTGTYTWAIDNKSYLPLDGTSPMTGAITINSTGNGIYFKSGVTNLTYDARESSSYVSRQFLGFDHTNNASYPYLTNKTPSGDVVIKTGTAAGGGENEHFRINGGDGQVQTTFTNTDVSIDGDVSADNLGTISKYNLWKGSKTDYNNNVPYEGVLPQATLSLSFILE